MLLGLLAACGAPPTPQLTLAELHGTLAATVTAANRRAARGDWLQAHLLATAVSRHDPEAEGLAVVNASLAPHRDALSPPRLGSNVALRAPAERPWWAATLLYLPDRLLDLLDVVSLDLHAGFGLFVDIHATHTLAITAGSADTHGVGWYDHRILGTQRWARSRGVLAADGPAFDVRHTAGLGGRRVSMAPSVRGLGGASGLLAPEERPAPGWLSPWPGDPLYREQVDFWELGATVTVVVVGVGVEIHPLEIADLVTGLFTYDLLGDDLATTTAPAFTPEEQHLLDTLEDHQVNEALVARYARAVEDEQGHH